MPRLTRFTTRVLYQGEDTPFIVDGETGMPMTNDPYAQGTTDPIALLNDMENEAGPLIEQYREEAGKRDGFLLVQIRRENREDGKACRWIFSPFVIDGAMADIIRTEADNA